MFTKCPSVSPVSGEKKRNAMTTEMQLKINAQLQADAGVLSTFKVREAKP